MSKKSNKKIPYQTSKINKGKRNLKPREPEPNFFEVLILATMSSGKSTLLNAMLGLDLMPTSNQACTAKIFRIEDFDQLTDFQVETLSNSPWNPESKWQKVDRAHLNELNQSSAQQQIKIRGNILGIDNHHSHLVIYDTPGPNNSSNPLHAETTDKLLRDGCYGAVLYVMNAKQFGIDDDKALLDNLKKISKNENKHFKKIIFVLNKTDALDEEKGETLVSAVQDAIEYLQEIGFLNPTVIPVSAFHAGLARKALLGQELASRDKSRLVSVVKRLDQPRVFRNLANAKLPQDFTHLQAILAKALRLEKRDNEQQIGDFFESDLEAVLAQSGLLVLEKLLDDLVKKQAKQGKPQQ
ncbi:MAG: dynamin family protein [Thiomicrospira sp.]|jgi:GTPase Era involved in 16S rRNA processing|nr:dynamin family protein [Thiomicrospira sp.]